MSSTDVASKLEFTSTTTSRDVQVVDPSTHGTRCWVVAADREYWSVGASAGDGAAVVLCRLSVGR